MKLLTAFAFLLFGSCQKMKFAPPLPAPTYLPVPEPDSVVKLANSFMGQYENGKASYDSSDKTLTMSLSVPVYRKFMWGEAPDTLAIKAYRAFFGRCSKIEVAQKYDDLLLLLQYRGSEPPVGYDYYILGTPFF